MPNNTVNKEPTLVLRLVAEIKVALAKRSFARLPTQLADLEAAMQRFLSTQPGKEALLKTVESVSTLQNLAQTLQRDTADFLMALTHGNKQTYSAAGCAPKCRRGYALVQQL